ncbi:MAG: radical SAM protein, partial [Flavobacteriales bacterium]
IEWIRLHYAFPSGFPMDAIEMMAQKDNICKYIDMPLQHASTNMLKAMRRGITREKTTALIKDIRERIPGIAIRTTLISGYPGETQEDHEEVLEWIDEMQFERLGVFQYSHEENTHAHKSEDDVPDEVKKARAEEIMDRQAQISHDLNQAKVGKTFKVLIDKKEGPYFIGRTEHDSPEVDNEVLIKADSDTYLRIGDFVDVTISEADHFDLYGTVSA